MFEFFVALYNLLPGGGYGLAIIILSVIVLILSLVLVFEEVRLRKIIKDLESKLESLEKNYQPEDENLHKEDPLQRALHKFDDEVETTEKKNDVVDLPEEPESIKKIENIQKEVYGDAVLKKTKEDKSETKNLEVEELIGGNEITTAGKRESMMDEGAPVAVVGAKEDLPGASGLRKPYIKKQSSTSPATSEAVSTLRKPYAKHLDSNQFSELNISIADIAQKSSVSRKSRGDSKDSSIETSATQHAMPDISEKGRDSVSRYEVKKEFIKMQDKTKTGIGLTHVTKRYERRQLEDELLPGMLTGKRIETKEIEGKIKALEHDKFIARKFKEGKYERSRIQDNIDYLKGVEKNLFGKK